MRGGSADNHGSAAFTSEARKRKLYDMCPSTNGARNFVTLAVEIFGRIGVEGSNCVDQLAAGGVGRRDGGSKTKKVEVEEQLLQIISVTVQVDIMRRVSRSQLQLRDRQEARRGRGDDRPTLMASPHR